MNVLGDIFQSKQHYFFYWITTLLLGKNFRYSFIFQIPTRKLEKKNDPSTHRIDEIPH